MANRNALVVANGNPSELPGGDSLGAVPFSGYVSVTSSLTLTAAHHGRILVVTATNSVALTVPVAGLPAWFYCRVITTSAAGWFRVAGASGVTVVSSLAGALAVKVPYVPADIYAISPNTYLLDSQKLQLSYLLNGISSSPLLAASVARRLTSSYTGNLIEVRRSSDNVTQTLGLGSDVLSTTALTNFTGSGSGYIRTVYDQSGGGLNLAQTATANQPRVVNSGTVELLGGQPTMRALAAGTWLDATVNITSGILTVGLVGTLTSSATDYARLVSLGVSGSTDYNNVGSMTLDRNGVNSVMQAERNGSGFVAGGVTYNGAFSYVARWDGTNLSLFLNGVLVSTSSSTGNFSATLFRVLNDVSSSRPWDGTLAELLVFSTAITNAEVATLHADWKTFYSIA